MREARFAEEQIVGVLKEHEAGASAAVVCRRHGISEQTFYRWRAKYGGLDVGEAPESPGRQERVAPAVVGTSSRTSSLRVSTALRALAARGPTREPQAGLSALPSRGLAVRRRKRKRVAAQRGQSWGVVTGPSQRWSLDFLSDASAQGRRLRILGVLDVFTREALAIEVDTSLPSSRVVRVLECIIAERQAVPTELVLDNGPKLTSRVLDQCADERRVQLRFIAPGKPIQNAFTESFNGWLRDECLNQHWFLNLTDARLTIEAWRQDEIASEL